MTSSTLWLILQSYIGAQDGLVYLFLIAWSFAPVRTHVNTALWTGICKLKRAGFASTSAGQERDAGKESWVPNLHGQLSDVGFL